MYKIIFTDCNTKDYVESLKLRLDVFIAELGGNVSTEVNDEERCISLLVKDGDKCVATSRIHPISEEDARIERIAVHRDYRSEGLGKMMMDSAEKRCIDMGIRKVYIYARDTAVGFYKSLGYKAFGQVFQRDSVDHIQMVKDIK